MDAGKAPGTRRILFALAILGAILFLSYEGSQPPNVVPAGAPATQFSGARAREVLSLLVGDGIPHPTGSPANDAVRDRVIEELQKSGYDPQVQTGFACSEYGTCATVNNVVARLDGTEVGPAVLLAAHYDSVPAGPGASDDGAGVAAVLEIARALKSLPRPRHSIIFLIDDGEEAGLLGARLFVEQHPWAKELRAAVNIDARGSSGASLMFETGSANEWVVRLYARNVRHPATSSIFYTAYKRLPNDTDFTVFKAADYQGLNFANIGHVADYHTPLDNLGNADPRTLQHHGDNALPSVLALANSDLTNPPRREAVFFDLFGRRTIWWPAAWSQNLAWAVLVLLVFQIVWMIWSKRLGLGAFARGLFQWPIALFATIVLALLLRLLVRLPGAIPVNWVAHPVPLVAAFWLLGLTIVVIIARSFSGAAGFWGLWAGVWVWWAILSLVLAWRLPGVSYAVLIPSAVAGLAGLPFTMRRRGFTRGSWIPAILPLAIAAIVGFAPVLMLYTALGNRFLPAIALVIAVLLTPLAPLLADLDDAPGLSRLAALGIPIALTILAAFLAVVVPAFSAKVPEHVNIDYWRDGDSGKAQWLVFTASGRLPEPIGVAAPFHRPEKGPLPWFIDSPYLTAAPQVDLAAPTFTILESAVAGNERSYRALLRSERGAPAATTLFPPNSGVDSVEIEGQPLQPESESVKRFLNGWTAYDCVTMPAKGIEIRFRLPVGKPVQVYAADRSYGLPAEGLPLLKSRPLTATQAQDGDKTIVSRRVQLNP
ncbi:MAG: M20/M25/M40 family metallo-hydrolase [Candidatus Acidiferrales bacterium]